MTITVEKLRKIIAPLDANVEIACMTVTGRDYEIKNVTHDGDTLLIEIADGNGGDDDSDE